LKLSPALRAQYPQTPKSKIRTRGEKLARNAQTRKKLVNKSKIKTTRALQISYLDGRSSVVAQARRVHFRFRPSFRTRFQHSVLKTAGQSDDPFFESVFGEVRFTRFGRPSRSRFAEKRTEEDDEQSDERGEELFSRR
jgi:hypothetical protein